MTTQAGEIALEQPPPLQQQSTQFSKHCQQALHQQKLTCATDKHTQHTSSTASPVHPSPASRVPLHRPNSLSTANQRTSPTLRAAATPAAHGNRTPCCSRCRLYAAATFDGSVLQLAPTSLIALTQSTARKATIQTRGISALVGACAHTSMATPPAKIALEQQPRL